MTTDKSSEHMLHYYWLHIKTRLGRLCCYIDMQFDNVSFAKGEYYGSGAVVGVPACIVRDQSALLEKLEKYRGSRNQVTLTISERGYRYSMSSGLRVIISRGTKGTLFAGDRCLARIEGPSTAWLSLEPKYLKYV